jgi:hypothetical protein
MLAEDLTDYALIAAVAVKLRVYPYLRSRPGRLVADTCKLMVLLVDAQVLHHRAIQVFDDRPQLGGDEVVHQIVASCSAVPQKPNARIADSAAPAGRIISVSRKGWYTLYTCYGESSLYGGMQS